MFNMGDGQRKIGIALSGGGIRATIFHLGVLKWMAENSMLDDIVRISTVSGASICIGLIYSHNNYRWPTNKEYISKVLPKIQKIILEKDIQNISLRKLIVTPWWLSKKVNLVAKVLQKHWGISGNISDLAKKPMWYINCTTFETGKRFRFSQEVMGDYQLGYVEEPKFSIADAVASSAGFPIFIGPYKMRTDRYLWVKSFYAKKDWASPKNKYIHLWDGGVYDNLGLESVYKLDDGGSLSEGVNYLIVSNASGSSGYKKREKGFSKKNLKRLLDIAMDQVGALRTRDVMDYLKRTNNGLYLKIGNSAKEITEASGISGDLKEELIAQCMSSADAIKVREYPTTLRRPSVSNFDLILRHGYEVAKCTFTCYADKMADSKSPRLAPCQVQE